MTVSDRFAKMRFSESGLLAKRSMTGRFRIRLAQEAA